MALAILIWALGIPKWALGTPKWALDTMVWTLGTHKGHPDLGTAIWEPLKRALMLTLTGALPRDPQQGHWGTRSTLNGHP